MKSKRLLSLLMAGALSVALLTANASAVGAGLDASESEQTGYAESGPVNVTMQGTAESGYGAYRILDLELGLKVGHSNGDVCNLSDVNALSEHYAYKYTLNANYADAVKAAIKKVAGEAAPADGATDAEWIKAISGMTAEADIRAFADAVYAGVKGMPTDGEAPKTVDGQSEFSPKLETGGYYLIFEKTPTADGESVSLVMLDTMGMENITVKSKETSPELEKKIVDGEWVGGERRDTDLVAAGDTVKYEIAMPTPDKAVLNEWSVPYKYIVHDVITDTLTIQGDSVKVYIGADADSASEITSGFTVVTSADDGCSLEVRFADMRNTVGEGDKMLYVRYLCTVNVDAVTGVPGNPNDAQLEFSHNPYDEGDTTKTPKDEVAVFTFKLVVDKTDEDKQPLSGAGFTLYKIVDGEDVPVQADEAGKAVEMTSANDAGTTFSVSGLDVGMYKLVETTVPSGYQKVDDILFEIAAEVVKETDTPTDGKALTSLVVKYADGAVISDTAGSLVFKHELSSGEAATAVVNVTGNRLPTTGGSGTYMLYAGGAAIVLIGGVMFVASRKKSNGEA